ncbi:hypothetical protein BDF14DRAFT_1954164 [Spinellus fusiger]|nr:hypothetical protein BDF14DRAFT_1954164 [Spinellus fusiger]
MNLTNLRGNAYSRPLSRSRSPVRGRRSVRSRSSSRSSSCVGPRSASLVRGFDRAVNRMSRERGVVGDAPTTSTIVVRGVVRAVCVVHGGVRGGVRGWDVWAI